MRAAALVLVMGCASEPPPFLFEVELGGLDPAVEIAVDDEEATIDRTFPTFATVRREYAGFAESEAFAPLGFTFASEDGAVATLELRAGECLGYCDYGFCPGPDELRRETVRYAPPFDQLLQFSCESPDGTFIGIAD